MNIVILENSRKILNKNYLLFFILILFFGCANDSKEEDLKQIDVLKSKILNNETILKEQEVTIKRLEERIGIEKKQFEAIQNQIDSIIKMNELNNAMEAFSTANVFSNFYNDIDYEVTSTDNYWKRGAYYTSKNRNEFFYNVKATVVNEQLHFYFMGVEYPLKDEKVIATIYELNENKELHIIDKVDVSPGIKIDRRYDAKGERHLREYMLLQLDNLIVKNDKLYYYKFNGFDNNTNQIDISKKKFYEYSLTSKERPQRINNLVFSNISVGSAEYIKLISPDKSKLAVGGGEGMAFYRISDWENEYRTICFETYVYGKGFEEIDFDMKRHFEYSEEDFYLDVDTGKDLLFGGISWHSKKNILYFDNSGMTFRCIWEIDFDNDRVTKIVPEHEAIHPYFFQTYDKEYIAYVEENKIMLCEAPSANHN